MHARSPPEKWPSPAHGEVCTGLESKACRARSGGLSGAAGWKVHHATGLPRRQSRATGLFAARLPSVPSHRAFAKAVDHQQRHAEFRRSLWGFPPPFTILPISGEPTRLLVFFEECLPFLHIPQFPLSALDLHRAPMLCLHTFMEAAMKAELHLPLEVFLYRSHHLSA